MFKCFTVQRVQKAGARLGNGQSPLTMPPHLSGTDEATRSASPLYRNQYEVELLTLMDRCSWPIWQSDRHTAAVPQH